MRILTFTTFLICLLVLPLFYMAADSASFTNRGDYELIEPEPELIQPEWEVTELNIKVYWMNGQAIRTTWNKRNPDNLSLEAEEVLFAFSECDDPADWEDDNYTECFIFATFPRRVDDEYVCHLGHEVMHGFSGDYHGDQ